MTNLWKVIQHVGGSAFFSLSEGIWTSGSFKRFSHPASCPKAQHPCRALHPAHLVEDAGSVVCLWIRVRRMMWSFMDIWTSAGISGDVWLIFTAASRKLMAPVSLSLSAMFSLLQPASLCKMARLEEMALFLQGTQHSFQKRNRKTATKASPHTITITARRLTESSTGGEKATATGRGEERERRKEKKKDGEKAIRKGKKWSKLTYITTNGELLAGSTSKSQTQVSIPWQIRDCFLPQTHLGRNGCLQMARAMKFHTMMLTLAIKYHPWFVLWHWQTAESEMEKNCRIAW